MVFHCMTTCSNCVIISRTKYSFLSKQSAMRVCKRTGFLSLNRISELVWDSVSYEAGVPSYNSSEDEGGFEDKSGVSHLQPDQPTTRGHAVQQFIFFKCLLIKRKFFRVGHVNMSKQHPLHSGHGPLAS